MIATLQSCPLFCGLTDDELRRALDFFAAEQRQYQRGDLINDPGGRMERFGIVLSGAVHVMSFDINGESALMAAVAAGETFGEALCYLEREAHVCVYAAKEAEVLWLSARRLHSTDADALSAELRARFCAMLATRTLNMNDRIQALSKPTLRNKLITFFSECCRDSGEEFDLPFDRERMAAYLGAERSALSRELSNMRKDGLIEFHKSHFRIIKK